MTIKIIKYRKKNRKKKEKETYKLFSDKFNSRICVSDDNGEMSLRSLHDKFKFNKFLPIFSIFHKHLKPDKKKEKKGKKEKTYKKERKNKLVKKRKREKNRDKVKKSETKKDAVEKQKKVKSMHQTI